MFIVLIGIGLLWCFFTTVLGLSRIYIYIWFSQFGIDGLLAIIFCEIVGGAMDIAAIQCPITPVTEERLHVSGEEMYQENDSHSIDLYLLGGGFLLVGAVLITVTYGEIGHIIWEMQGLSILVFVVLWCWFLWKEKRTVTHLISITLNVALLLAVIKVFEGDVNSILLYTTVMYQFVFPLVYRKTKVPTFCTQNKGKFTNVSGGYEESGYAESLAIGVFSAHLVGTNKLMVCSLLNPKHSKHNYHRMMLMSVGGSVTSLLLAVYSLGSRDASANYIAMILRDVEMNVSPILCVLFMILCLLCCKCLHSATKIVLQCCSQWELQNVLHWLKLISLSSIAITVITHWSVWTISLILLISYCNLQFNIKNRLHPATSSVGLQMLPLLQFCKLL